MSTLTPLPSLSGRSRFALPLVLLSLLPIRAGAVPSRSAVHPAAPSSSVAAPASLLDEAGRLIRPVSPTDIAAWKTALHRGVELPARAAQLHVWLGEYLLDHDEDVAGARWHFAAARRLCHRSEPLFGLALYDTALLDYYDGAYADACKEYSILLTPHSGLCGYNWKSCVLFSRHARACYNYHLTHSRLGIPEPDRLDPLCGVSGLAVCLRAMGMAYDRAHVLKGCRATGLGSDLQDLVNAGPRLHVVTRAVGADRTGLIALPKPCLAYVEHDHWVAVVRADRSGVEYVCSDCGPWPGGTVSLRWDQYETMNPGLYVTVSKPGSAADRWLRAVLAGNRGPVRVASRGPLSGLLPMLTAVSAMKGHVFATLQGYPGTCGAKDSAQHCACMVEAPTSAPGPHAHWSTNDPVNLATGEEDYSPEPDLVVYNPIGPSVRWQRQYESLFNTPHPTDFGNGWSEGYYWLVSVHHIGYPYGNYITEPGGGQINMLVPSTPTASNPRVICTPQAGASVLVEWDYDGTSNGHFLLTFPDREQWTCQYDYMATGYLPAQIADRNGNYISLTWTEYYYPTTGTALSRISDSNNRTLLAISRNSDLTVSSVSDCYGRSVYYQYTTFNGYYSSSLVAHASQIVATGASNPPDRYAYTYTAVYNGEGESCPSLATITVPSPTGTGTSTATIAYTTAGLVDHTVDANGNITQYTYTASNATTVTTKDSQGNTVYSHTAQFDNNMSQTSDTDGSGAAIWTRIYNDPNDPYRPSATLAGPMRQWAIILRAHARG